MKAGHAKLIAMALALTGGLLSGCASGSHDAASPEKRLRVAEAAEKSGDLTLARTMYTVAAAEATNDRAARIAAAKGLARCGAPMDAVDLLKGILNRSPSDQEARRTLGTIQIESGMIEEGAGSLSVVVEADPKDTTARTNLGVALDMLNRHAEAEAMYRAVLARTPGDPEATNDLAYSLAMTGQLAAARQVLAPFRNRADLPDRLRATMRLVDGSAGPDVLRPAAMVPGVSHRPVSLNGSARRTGTKLAGGKSAGAKAAAPHRWAQPRAPGHRVPTVSSD